jgi:hypothetical protein
VVIEEGNSLDEEEGLLVDLFEPLVEDITMKNGVEVEVEQVLASPNQLIIDGEGKRMENEEVTLDIFETKEPLVENHPYMMVEVVAPLKVSCYGEYYGVWGN